MVYLKGQCTHLVGVLALQRHEKKIEHRDCVFHSIKLHTSQDFLKQNVVGIVKTLQNIYQTVAWWIRIARFFKGFKKLHVPDRSYGRKSQTDPAD